MEYHLKYHNGLKGIKIPGKANAAVLQPVAMSAQESLSKALGRALGT